MANGHGGYRPGSGAKKGVPQGPRQATITKAQAREAFRDALRDDVEPMIRAQVANALGLRYLVARHKASGKFVRLTKRLLDRILSGKDTQHEAIEVWSKDPSVHAFAELMNRWIDKPKEQAQELLITADAALIDALSAGRKRARELRAPVIDVKALPEGTAKEFAPERNS